MTIAYSINNRLDDFSRLNLCEEFLINDPIKHITTGQKLLYDVHIFIIFEHFKQVNDVRMVYVG